MPAPSPRQELTSQVLEELVAHQPAQAMRYMRRMAGGPVSLVHLQVLTALESDGPLPMRRLAEAMDVSQASATGIVDRMEDRGLVERLRDDEDRRVVRVALTETGRSTIGALTAERRELLVALLEELTDDELDGFLRGLRGMSRARQVVHDRLRAEHERANPGVPFHEPPAAARPAPEPEVAR
jgi:DNA-binding MarR family transcriptional regulator